MIYFTFLSIFLIYLHSSEVMIFILPQKVMEEDIFHIQLKESLMEKKKKEEMLYLIEQKDFS